MTTTAPSEARRVSLAERVSRLVALSTSAGFAVFAVVAYVVVFVQELREGDDETFATVFSEATAEVAVAIAVAAPIVLALTIFGSRYLIRRAMAPLERVVSEAAEISVGSIARRLPVPEEPDEVYDAVVGFNAALDRIETGFRSLDRFAAQASHELRTPLAVVRNELEVMLTRPRNSDQWEHTAAVCLDEVRRLSSLVETILEVSSSDERSDARKTHVDIGSLMNSVIARRSDEAAVRGLTLHASSVPEQPRPVIIGNPDALSVAIGRIVDNALRYTPSGGTVESSVIRLANGEVELIIDDSGPGIAESERERVFDPHVRGSASVSTGSDERGSGVGLGLALTRDILRRHDAAISNVASPLGGARFVIRFSLSSIASVAMFALGAALVWFIATPALALEPGDTDVEITPLQAAALAIDANAALRTRRVELMLIEPALVEAGLMPPFELAANIDFPVANTSAGDSAAYAAGIGWDANSARGRTQRVRSAELAGDQARLGLAWEEWVVANEVESLATELLFVQRRAELMREQAGVLEQRMAVVDRALGAGLLDQAVLRSTMEAAARARLDLDELLTQRRDLNDRLATMMGLSAGTDLRVVEGSPPAAVPDCALLVDGIDEQRLDLQALHARQQQAGFDVELATMSRLGPITVGVEAGRDTGGLVTAGVSASMSLPSRDRSDVAVDRAVVASEQVDAELSERLELATGDTARLCEQVALVDARVATIANLQAIVSSTAEERRDWLANGLVALTETWESDDAVFDAQLEALDASAELARLRLELQLVSGAAFEHEGGHDE